MNRLRKTRYDLIRDILEYCLVKSKNATQITQGIGYNQTSLNTLLKFLVSWELLQNNEVKSRIVFATSLKGKEWLTRFYGLQDLMKPNKEKPA